MRNLKSEIETDPVPSVRPFVRVPLYAANALNQYSAITNPDPGKRKIKGQVNTGASVTVTTRSGDIPVETGSVCNWLTKRTWVLC
jgi:hypothetical protein